MENISLRCLLFRYYVQADADKALFVISIEMPRVNVIVAILTNFYSQVGIHLDFYKDTLLGMCSQAPWRR